MACHGCEAEATGGLEASVGLGNAPVLAEHAATVAQFSKLARASPAENMYLSRPCHGPFSPQAHSAHCWEQADAVMSEEQSPGNKELEDARGRTQLRCRVRLPELIIEHDLGCLTRQRLAVCRMAPRAQTSNKEWLDLTRKDGTMCY